jgi:hypothetical protein
VRREQEKFLELKEAARKQKEIEREKILSGLRQIDDQEVHVDIKDVYRMRLELR